MNLNSLFDSCYNISVGSHILTDFYEKHSKTSSSPQETLLKAVSSYNTGHPYKGYYNGYVQRMLKSVNYAFNQQNVPTIAKSEETSKPAIIATNDVKQALNPKTLVVASEFEETETLQGSPKTELTSFFFKKTN